MSLSGLHVFSLQTENNSITQKRKSRPSSAHGRTDKICRTYTNIGHCLDLRHASIYEQFYTRDITAII